MACSTKHDADDEAIRRIWDVIEIQNLMGRHAYCHAYDMHEEEIEELWVSSPQYASTASFGQNWGYQVGIPRIRQYYVEYNREEKIGALEALVQADQSIENVPENLGIGEMVMHTLTTPYIEVAGDGRTAKGLWYSPGHVTAARSGQVDAMWMYEKYGVDFAKEDGEWKIWHLFVGTDFALPPGRLMKEEPVSDERETAKPPFQWRMSVPMDAYSSRHNCAAYPRIPEPYESFDPATGNGPEGNPAYRPGRMDILGGADAADGQEG